MYRLLSISLCLPFLILESTAVVASTTFNSPLKLKVFYFDPKNDIAQLQGVTPVSKGKQIILPQTLWYVRPVGSLTDEIWESLIQEISKKRDFRIRFIQSMGYFR